jgi:PAS domain S-box-containing protein
MTVQLKYKPDHFSQPGVKAMSYVIAVLLLIFSQAVVPAEEIKAVNPVQQQASKTVLHLTDGEQEWLARHAQIRIAYDGSLPPYSFVNDLGQIDGIAVEIMAILGERLGINFTVYPNSNWSHVYKAAAKRKVDIVATMVNRPDRAEWFGFTKPYLTKSLVIVTRQDNTTINNRNDIADKRIAVVKGYQYAEQLGNEFPATQLVKVKTMLDSLTEVDKRQVDAAILFLGTANYLQGKHQLDNLKIAAFYDRNSANESVAVRKDWPILVGILQKGLDSLTEEEVQKIFAKWVVGGGIPSNGDVEPPSQPSAEPITKPEALPTPVATPAAPPAEKPVIEVEQRPATFSIPKKMLEPSKETLEIGKMTVVFLLVLVLFLLWYSLVRKQRKGQHKSKNDMMLSPRNLQSAQNEAMHLTIEPSVEPGEIELKPSPLPKPNLDLDLGHLKAIRETKAEILTDEIIRYQRESAASFSYVSPSVTGLLGYSEADFMANYRRYMTDNPINRRQDEYFEACMQGQPCQPYEIEIFDAEQGLHWFEVTDSPIYDGQGHCIGVAGVMRDITSQHLYGKLSAKSAEPEVMDSSAPPPGSLREFLQQAIQAANTTGKPFAIIYVALARLRLLDGNSTNISQEDVFNEANKRLYATVRDTDTVVQMGADRYLLILPETDANSVSLIVEKTRKILQVPYLVGVQSIVLDANLGSAVYPGAHSDPDALLNEAQTLFTTTDAANTPSTTQTDDSNNLEDESFRLQQDLVSVLDECKVSLRATSANNINALNRNSQFSLHYQSRHDLKGYNITGFEALIRWQHPQLGQIQPIDFIYLVEDIGLMDVLSYWIIQQVSFQALAWEKQGIRPNQMIVNLGEVTSKQSVQVDKIIAIIKETGAKPEWLVLSIPEKEIAKNPNLVIPVIQQMVSAGLVVAIDNFGSDNAVMELMNSIPAQIIELDPAFIRTLPRNKADAELVTLTTAMLHEAGKTVVAKAVETEKQLEFLRANGCDMMQGHLLSRPLPAKEALELLKTMPDFAWYLLQK